MRIARITTVVLEANYDWTIVRYARPGEPFFDDPEDG
jgi:hypothetical protein